MDEIRLKNFRCFRDEQRARLAPLTLLVGENSTGKSSFMAMVRALWDVAHRRTPGFKEAPYDLGSFDEMVHYRKGKGGRSTSFEAGFDEISRLPGNQLFHFDAVFSRSGTVAAPARRRLASGGVWIEERLEDDLSWWVHFGTANGKWKRKLRTDIEKHLPSEFRSLISFPLQWALSTHDADPVSLDESPPMTESDQDQFNPASYASCSRYGTAAVRQRARSLQTSADI